MRFGIGYWPKHITLYDDYGKEQLTVKTEKEALEIIKALRGYFNLSLKEDPMTQEEASKWQEEQKGGGEKK